MSKEKTKGQWSTLFRYLKHSISYPWSSINFTLYFLVVVVGIGSLGLITTFFELQSQPGFSMATLLKNKQIINSITTYSLALLAAASIDYILKNDVSHSDFKVLTGSITMFGISLIVVGVVLFFIALLVESGILFAGILLLFSWFVWIISNHNNSTIDEGLESGRAATNTIPNDINPSAPKSNYKV